VGAVAIALIVAGLWLALTDRSDRQPSPTQPPVPTPEAPAAAPAPQPEEGVASVESGQTVTLSAASAMEEGAVLDLVLGEPSNTEEPLSARILAEGRELPLFAILSEDRTRARIVVPPGWLSPGRYLVEVKTTERSHFPLRRYVIEVR